MSRKFSPQTKSWQLFEKLFLDMAPEKYPFTIPGLTKGRAVNMAMTLNGCQQYWATTQGIPQDMLQYSAKAKATPSGAWVLEVSESPKHTGRRKGAEWLDDILAAVTSSTSAPATIPAADPMESAINSWLGNESPEPPPGVDEGK